MARNMLQLLNGASGRRRGIRRPPRSPRLAFAQVHLYLPQLRPVLGEPLLQAGRDRCPIPHPRRLKVVEEIFVDRHVHALRRQEPFHPIDQARPIFGQARVNRQSLESTRTDEHRDGQEQVKLRTV